MSNSKNHDLIIPKLQIAILLFTSLAIFICSILFEQFLGDLNLWFIIGSFLLFIPAYITLFLDMASRPITHLWTGAMLIVPIITPFAYLAVRDRLKTELPVLV